MKKPNTAGYVYILSNPSMPGIVKIGRSIHGGRSRALEIYRQGGTGVPMPFKMEFEIWSEDCITDELLVHEELQNYRINQDREFFSIDVYEAREAVLRVIGYSYSLSVGKADFTITEETLMASYGHELYEFISENFPGVPFEIILAQSIGSYLSNDSIKDAVLRNKEAFEKRRENKKIFKN